MSAVYWAMAVFLVSFYLMAYIRERIRIRRNIREGKRGQ